MVYLHTSEILQQAWFFLVVFFCASSVGSPISKIVDRFFSLFQTPCEDWVGVFSPNATFNHPKAGRVQGKNELVAFCAQAQSTPSVGVGQIFRSDGPARITEVVGAIDVLVPYVYALSQTNVPFVNSGWECVEIDADSLLIVRVTEFFNSNRTVL